MDFSPHSPHLCLWGDSLFQAQTSSSLQSPHPFVAISHKRPSVTLYLGSIMCLGSFAWSFAILSVPVLLIRIGIASKKLIFWKTRYWTGQ